MTTTLSLPAPHKAPRWDGAMLAAQGTSWLWVGLLAVAIGLPLAAILGQAFLPQDQVSLAVFQSLFEQPGFAQAARQSLIAATATTLVVIPIAFAFAACLQRVALPGKAGFRLVMLLPLLAPSLLPGIALVYLFGHQGLLKSWLPDGQVYGLPGIVLGEVFYTLPHALMVLMTTLAIGDRRLYEAATTLGAGPIRRFLTITLPSARYGLISASLLVFTLAITDFGVPKVIGGQYAVLSVDIYKQVVGQQNFPRGAAIGLLLLLPALLSFVIDRLVARRQQLALANRAEPLQAIRHPALVALATGFCLLVSLALCSMLGTAIGAAFIKSWPYQLTPTLAHFDFDNVDGEGWLAFTQSLTLAGVAAVVGTMVVLIGAWLTERLPLPRFARQSIQALAMLPMAVPGLVLGLGYIFFFNAPGNPLHGLYGTLPLLVICTIAHFYTTAHLTAVTSLKQLNGELEAVAASLGVSCWRTLWRVTLPASLPALLDMARYFFVSAMTTVSAVVLLYTPEHPLAAIAVVQMDDAGDTAAAAAMATLIVAANLLACLVFNLLTRGVARRSMRWRQAG
ncbi:iron(III) transport system permease protein [Chitinivorax tropicus]|uniref:Iron(III) transport system permease protein n=1 Tax=Chitinivorax tropicus TaxID=714531 RepID=A0A840MQ52_9PROT|nr:putative 2-aminoethylphosphonate ABC transporter permease subunit [Chitinivorax tropicus]MBB5018596.1 iron(III) transport system permease protein [Chitinivorax tropicus]